MWLAEVNALLFCPKIGGFSRIRVTWPYCSSSGAVSESVLPCKTGGKRRV